MENSFFWCHEQVNNNLKNKTKIWFSTIFLLLSFVFGEFELLKDIEKIDSHLPSLGFQASLDIEKGDAKFWNIYLSQMRASYSFWDRQLKFSANAGLRIFWNLTKKHFYSSQLIQKKTLWWFSNSTFYCVFWFSGQRKVVQI